MGIITVLEQPMQVEHAVHCKSFVWKESNGGGEVERQGGGVVVEKKKRVEMEFQAQRLSKFQEAISSPVKNVEIMTRSGDPKHGRRVEGVVGTVG